MNNRRTAYVINLIVPATDNLSLKPPSVLHPLNQLVIIKALVISNNTTSTNDVPVPAMDGIPTAPILN